MEITYLGHSCFKLKSKSGLQIYIDPYKEDAIGQVLPKDVADVLLISHDHVDHNAKELITGAVSRPETFVIDKEGEYEIAGVLIAALKTYHDKTNGEERGKNLIFSMVIDGLNIVHLGDLGHKISSGQLEKLGSVDILMIPVGGVFSLDAEMALDQIKEISPSYVIPMHYKTTASKDQFLKMDGLERFLEKNKFPTTAESVHKIKLDLNDMPDDIQVLLMNG